MQLHGVQEVLSISYTSRANFAPNFAETVLLTRYVAELDKIENNEEISFF